MNPYINKDSCVACEWKRSETSKGMQSKQRHVIQLTTSVVGQLDDRTDESIKRQEDQLCITGYFGCLLGRPMIFLQSRNALVTESTSGSLKIAIEIKWIVFCNLGFLVGNNRAKKEGPIELIWLSYHITLIFCAVLFLCCAISIHIILCSVPTISI